MNTDSFQAAVRAWTHAAFGETISLDVNERNQRFLEESLELVQACAFDRKMAHKLVDYVYDREVGQSQQELGGVLVTLAALSNAQGLSMEIAAETELMRCWENIEKIRAKQKAKPRFDITGE